MLTRTTNTALLLGVALLLSVVGAEGADTTLQAGPSTADASEEELIEIMKGVHFVPELGKDNPFCKAFYEDFKKQARIEHIKPIVAAETYDDPALKTYRDKCPKFDFRRTLSASVGNTRGWTKEAWETLGIHTYGLSNFALYSVDLDNNPTNEKELVFYYEGESSTGLVDAENNSDAIAHGSINPAARAYQAIDLKRCEYSSPGGTLFNRLGSAKWTRNGIITYRGKNAIYELVSTDQREYWNLTLDMYSTRLKRIAPTCTYNKPRK